MTPIVLDSPGGIPVVYPNPLKEGVTATVRVKLDSPGWIQIKVFTLAFRKIYEDTQLDLAAGTRDIPLDIGQFKGSFPANGLYYLLVRTPGRQWNVKFLILR